MGNKRKIDKWLPADSFRIKAFARAFASKVTEIHPGQELKTSNIQKALSNRSHSIEISGTTLRNWLAGEDRPSAKYIQWFERELPGCAAWLVPDINSSPIRRFYCALDIWGSRIDSPRRKLDSTSPIITAGRVLTTLARRWASVVVTSEEKRIYGYAIPKLKCLVPHQVPSTVYQSANLLSLMDFMFRCGAYLELTEEDFKQWAIDLASLTLIIRAFFEGSSLTDQLQSGRTGDYASLTFRIFFRANGDWPNLESVSRALRSFPELEDSVINYSQRLMLAREVLKQELRSIGNDLSIVGILFDRIEDRNRMWQEPLDAQGETFAKTDLLRVKRNLSPVAPGRYRYELRNLANGKRTALCHDLENGAKSALPNRPDLYDGYSGSFSWGYSGSGPTFLAISILAHHLGHSDFGFEEINRLLDTYISRVSGNQFMGPFFLATELIDRCLNE